MLQIKWTDRITNGEVIQTAKKVKVKITLVQNLSACTTAIFAFSFLYLGDEKTMWPER